jgi:hypothetical protein
MIKTKKVFDKLLAKSEQALLVIQR